MTEGYQIVPWYNRDEWQNVYDHISDISPDTEAALGLLLIWKARCPSLPSGIESTLSLLQVRVQDTKKSDDFANDQLLRLAYSSAIMRFVNHMLDTETAKGSSLYQAARNRGVPDWIVDLRHDTAHSNNLPPITLLREACEMSLEWLRKNYWDKHREHIQDYLSGQKVPENIDESTIAALINLATSLGFCTHSNCKIKNLSNIPDEDMKESIISDARDLLGDQIDMSKLKTVSVMSLIKLVSEQSKKLLKSKEAAVVVNETLLSDGSLFLSQELLHYFGEKEFRNKNKLRKNYVQCFEVLLSILHSNEMLVEFILALVKITQTDESGHFRAQLASLWVSEILVALRKSKSFLERLAKMDAKEIKLKKKKDLLQLYHHWFPSDSVCNLMLDLQTSVPRELTDINFVQTIIATYNPYLNNFVRDLLCLVEPPLPSEVANRICQLAELVSVPEKFPVSSSSKIFTEDDLKTVVDSCDDSIEIIENEDGRDEMCEESVQAPMSGGIWRLASREHSWSICPIGNLPCRQQAVSAMETI